MIKSKNLIQDKYFNNIYIYAVIKRLLDILISIALMPLLLFITGALFFLNAFFNNGKIYFIQKRMGMNCEPFFAIKFRTMKSTDIIKRKYSDPLEIDRITRLGNFLRKTKIDELPQILNVLRGEMSLIGPRPDYYEHALSFLEYIPSYRHRHSIKPGITGLSQIRLGYAEGIRATKLKSKVDHYYIKNVCFKLDFQILIATIFVIINTIKS